MTFIQNIPDMLKKINLWHFVWISVVCSEIFTSIMSILLRGRIVYDYLITGGVVSLIVTSAVIYLILQIRKIEKQAAESLMESEAKYKEIANSVPGVVYQFTVKNDGSYSFPYVDENCEKFFHHKAKAVVADPNLIFNMVPPKELQSFIDSIEESSKTLMEWRHDFRVVLPDGQERWFEGRSVPHLLQSGEPFWNGVVTDITERKHVEEELKETNEFLKSILESSSAVSIISTDWEGNILYWNQGAENMFGYNSEEIVGHQKIGILYPDDEEETLNLIKDMRSFIQKNKKGTSCEVVEVTKEGHKLWTHLTLSPRLNEHNEVIGILGIGEDITERKKIEDELHKSQDRYRSIYENATIGIYRTTPDGKILMSNPALIKLLGYKSFDELSKINLEENGFESNQARHDFRDEIEKRGTISGRIGSWQTKDDKLVHVRESARVYRDQEGNILFYEGIVEDITERKKAEEKLENYANKISAINEASHTLASSLNLQTVVDNCTHIAKQMFDADDVVVFIVDEDKKYLAPLAYTGSYTEEIMSIKLKIGEGLTGEVAQRGLSRIVNRIDLKDIGKHVPGTPEEPESIMSVPLKIKDLVIGAMTLSKLGELEFHKEDLKFMENLADISSVAIQNARLYKDVKQSEKLKTLFLANMSHEIRTPLNSITGYSDLIEDSVGDKVGPEEKQFFEIIRNSNERLLRTIHSVLDMSQLEAMSFELQVESVDINKLAELLVVEHKSRAEESNLEMNFESKLRESIIKVDKYCISQALSNLLDNAIKYTKKGHITILLYEKDRKIILKIIDTGIGMTEKYQEDLFEVFSQESIGYTKEYQGVGLGLALTKRYLDLNEIHIKVFSEKNVGTTFTLTFPSYKMSNVVSKREGAKISSSEPADKKAIKDRLLVVDDDANAQKLYKYFLAERYNTVFAVSVTEAKQQLKENKVDLILLDLSLIGNEDGLDLARYLRKTQEWKELPIIAVTAHAFTADRENCLVAGCNDYMSKPIKKPDLLKTITQYV